MISSLLHDPSARKSLIKKVVAAKPSPARSTIIKLLTANKADLIQAIADTWFQRTYGVKPLGTTLKVPDSMLPKGEPGEVFQAITDHLKKSI